MSDEQPIDPETGWVAEHLRAYLESDGADGHLWRGVPTLLLTTRGRRSGRLRRTPLIYGRDGDAYVIVASKGGTPEHPAWFLNLRDRPDVEVSMKGGPRVPMRARVVGPEERARLWPQIAQRYRNYAGYQRRIEREIPLVVLEPVSLGETRTVSYVLTNRAEQDADAEKEARRDAAFVTQTGAVEDGEMVTAIQRSIASDANDVFTFGRFEGAIVHFHRELDALLTG